MRPDFKLYLPTKEEEESPQIYVNKKLVPLAQELYQMANKCVSHGAPEDQSSIDMIPQELGKHYHDINTYLETKRNKTCSFFIDPNQPLEKRGKFLKIMVKMTIRSDNGNPVAFRLVQSKTGAFIKGSVIQCAHKDFREHVANVQFGHEDGYVKPGRYDYHVQAKYVNEVATPIIKRFSMDTVYA